MNQQVLVQEKRKTGLLEDFANSRELCKQLMQTPHYARITEPGIMAIVETAKSLGIDPRLALGGGLYFVKGKVEMSARMMNALIRSKKHSITRDKRSDDKICILHGKRADNNDTWTESFSLEEAHRAGLTNNPVWKNFTRDMLFARALSRLARQLFPDIIGNCYVEGEISLDSNISSSSIDSEDTPEKEIEYQQLLKIGELLAQQPDRESKLLEFISKNWSIKDLRDLSFSQAEWVLERLSSYQESELQEVSA